MTRAENQRRAPPEILREEVHHQRLRRLLELARERRRTERRRSYLHQRPRRELESLARRGAVEYRRFRIIEGAAAKEVATELGRSRRTLCDWSRRWREDKLGWVARGRPLLRSSAWERNRVIAALELFGPAIGRGTCRWLFPELPRAEVEDLVDRYRRVYMKKHAILVGRLRWLVPGTVWAMDHATAPGAIDGVFPTILAVRDLASGEQLLWLPVEDATAQSTTRALEELRREHGLPLVLKSDQGPAFLSDVMAEYLERHGVTHLLSPPYMPQYNGACEAAIGWMKARTRYQAARRGSTKEWSSDDLEAARTLSNETPRSHHPRRQSPEEIWQGRTQVTSEAREAFRDRVLGELERLEEERARATSPARSAESADDLQRKAITRALVALGILQIRRRRIPLPKQLIFRAKIA